MSKPNGILAMNPEKYREIDGVVFDLYLIHIYGVPLASSASMSSIGRSRHTAYLP